MAKRKAKYDFRLVGKAAAADIVTTKRHYPNLFEHAIDVTVAKACKSFGVSRTTYYKWLRRFAETGTFRDQSRRAAPKKQGRERARRFDYQALFTLSRHTNVVQACRAIGISRTSYYKWKKRLEQTGRLEQLSRAPRKRPQAVDTATFKALHQLLRRHKHFGVRRLAEELRRRGFKISPMTISRYRRKAT